MSTIVLTVQETVLQLAVADCVTAGNTLLSETPTGTKNGVNKTFTISNTAETGTEIVILNQTIMRQDVDYTFDGDTITMITYAPEATEFFRILYVEA